MKASPGRIVIYTHHLSDRASDDLPAIVLFVQERRDGTQECKLHVFGTNAPLEAGWVGENLTGEFRPDSWRWPPRVEG